MEETSNSFNNHVTQSILATNDRGITEVVGLNTIKTIYFDRQQYDHIVALVQQNKIAEILKMPMEISQKDFDEYLIICEFYDQTGRKFIATVYDSDALWQNPEYIDIVEI